uniref:Serosal cuticle-related protein 8 n=1 Tax=Nilaparvata lugens TaxID=108931 RepID=A0A6G5SX56_NILLU|nr:serosal cuticle-related protein 8 [Nilaparvata lugens]
MLLFKFLIIIISFNCYNADFLSNMFSKVADVVYYKCEIDKNHDMIDLHYKLKKNLFGQPLVEDVVINAVSAHIKGNSQKPLTISFHGWPGCGKNFVADYIVESLFHKKEKSINYFLFTRATFLHLEHDIYEYRTQLKKKLIDSAWRCPHFLFIFDEVDKMPKGALDVVKSFIDYRTQIDNVDFRKTIFIFLSNVGSNKIVQKTIELWEKGVVREDFKMEDFESFLAIEAFNDDTSGFYMSDIIESHLIDHYVPFLPLEEEHVRKCIKAEITKQSAHLLNVDEVLDKIKRTQPFGPKPYNLYASSGCKQIKETVSFLQMKKSRRKDEF